MHDWALAEAVIAAASKIVKKEGSKEVEEVKIKVGALQRIELDILEFALSQLKSDPLQNAKFSIEFVKVEFKCRVCGNKWLFRKDKLEKNTAEAIHFVPEVVHTYLKCPNCASPDFEVLKGRRLA